MIEIRYMGDIIFIIAYLLMWAALAYFFLYRNFRTRDFLILANETCCKRQSDIINKAPTNINYDLFMKYKHVDSEIEKIASGIYSVSYSRVLFSFRALTFENWFTEEQVKFLRGEIYKPEDVWADIMSETRINQV